ncbi:serine/threonine-protein kinase [Chondromyces crocatus]|nr:serine/threonine-protein kinase [Chondromyces crocatus]
MPPVLGAYQLGRRLGAGTMGVVHEAIDRRNGHRVALKTLERLDPAGLYRLKHEFRVAADLSHPNLVALHELVCDQGIWFFTMELVEGENFLEHLAAHRSDATRRAPSARRNGGPPDVHRTWQSGRLRALFSSPGVRGVRARNGLVRPVDPASDTNLQQSPRPRGPASRLDALRAALLQLVCAIDALHRAGKVHRDIKPANLLITPGGRLVVLDFGLTSATGERDGRNGEGTPGYMAPEQAHDATASPASDWYAVGGVLYHALTGQLPFAGSALDILSAKLAGEPRPPSAITQGVPPDLDALCVSLLRRVPAERPTAPELLHALLAHGSAPTSRTPCITHWAPCIDPAASQDTLTEPPDGLLIGRARALDELIDTYRTLEPGKPAWIHVRGPAGIGKTTLLRAFTHRVRCEASPLDPPSSPPLPSIPPAPPAPRALSPERTDPTLASLEDAPPMTVRTVRREPCAASWAPRGWRDPSGPASPPEKGPVVLSSRCHDREDFPFKLLDGIVDALSQLFGGPGTAALSPDAAHQERALDAARACTALQPAEACALLRVFPVLAHVAPLLERAGAAASAVFPRGPLADLQGASLKRKATTALRSLLCALTSRAPLLLLLDDLQWGDPQSAEMLREILRPPGAPTLLLITAHRTGLRRDPRDTEPPACTALAATLAVTTVIELGALSRHESRQLAQALLHEDRRVEGDQGCPAAVAQAERIALESGGCPRWLEALASHARHGGRPLLQEVIATRIEALPVEARKLLALVASAPAPLPRSAVLAAAGADASRTLQLLSSAGLIVLDAGPTGPLVRASHPRPCAQHLATAHPPTRALPCDSAPFTQLGEP